MKKPPTMTSYALNIPRKVYEKNIFKADSDLADYTANYPITTGNFVITHSLRLVAVILFAILSVLLDIRDNQIKL